MQVSPLHHTADVPSSHRRRPFRNLPTFAAVPISKQKTYNNPSIPRTKAESCQVCCVVFETLAQSIVHLPWNRFCGAAFITFYSSEHSSSCCTLLLSQSTSLHRSALPSTLTMGSVRRTKNFANDSQTPIFLYTILKQLDLKSVDWPQVARSLEISNGHAARMRYSRMKQQFEGLTGQPKAPRARKEKVKASESASKPSKENTNGKRALLEEENERLAREQSIRTLRQEMQPDNEWKRARLEASLYDDAGFIPLPDYAQHPMWQRQPAIGPESFLLNPVGSPRGALFAPNVKMEPDAATHPHGNLDPASHTIKQEHHLSSANMEGVSIPVQGIKEEPGFFERPCPWPLAMSHYTALDIKEGNFMEIYRAPSPIMPSLPGARFAPNANEETDSGTSSPQPRGWGPPNAPDAYNVYGRDGNAQEAMRYPNAYVPQTTPPAGYMLPPSYYSRPVQVPRQNEGHRSGLSVAPVTATIGVSGQSSSINLNPSASPYKDLLTTPLYVQKRPASGVQTTDSDNSTFRRAYPKPTTSQDIIKSGQVTEASPLAAPPLTWTDPLTSTVEQQDEALNSMFDRCTNAIDWILNDNLDVPAITSNANDAKVKDEMTSASADANSAENTDAMVVIMDEHVELLE